MLKCYIRSHCNEVYFLKFYVRPFCLPVILVVTHIPLAVSHGLPPASTQTQPPISFATCFGSPTSSPRRREDPSDQLCASDVVSSRDVDLATFARHWGNYAVRQFVLGLVSPDDVKDYLVSSPAGVGGATLSENEVEKMPGWYMFKLFLHGRSRSAVGLEESIDGYHGEGGEVHDHDDEAALREMLVPVQELLRGRYAAVGILEEWGPTLSLFNAALGVPGMDWHERFESTGKLNVDVRFEGQKRDALEMAMTDAEIKRHLWLDLLLYEHALDVFHEQRQLHGIV